MNLNRETNLLSNKKKIVSGFMIAFLVFAGLAVLISLSSDMAMGYTMPNGVSWNMDDLVANSAGAVTAGGTDEYHVHEDIYISWNSTLTVDPGQIVYFDLGTGLNVYGYLNSYGNATHMINYTSSALSPSYGDWDGITFFNGSGGSVSYVSIDYAENGIFVNNTMMGPITYSEFRHNVWGVRVLDSYSFVYSNTFISNGILAHPDPQLSVGGGVLVDGFSYGSVSNNDFFTNIGGLRIGITRELYVTMNVFIDNTVYGVYCEESDYWNQSYITIIDNEITLNEYYGIYSDPGNGLNIDLNNITDNRIGIHVEVGSGTTPGGGIIISNNYIAFNTENGIECYGGVDPSDMSPTITGNEIISNAFEGILCQDCNAYISDNDIIDNEYGVFALGSTLTIENTYFNLNGNTIWSNASTIQITDSNIESSTTLDMLVSSGSYVTSLNTTFDDDAVYIIGDLSTLEVQWYLHILVLNVSGPVPSADVTVRDNPNGTWSDNFVTDSQGRVKWIVVVEYIRDRDNWVYYTPHNITATTATEAGYAEPIMDMSKYVVINIYQGEPPPPPPVPPLPPVDLLIALLGGDLELTWGASGDDGAGEDDVIEYNIYRADSVNGPYSVVGTVPADDSPMYSWLDSGKGDGDWNNYFYYVRAKDNDTLEDDNENKVGKFVSYLVEGWNLISVPFEQSDVTRESVLATIDGNYAALQGYHAGKSRPWLNWHRDKPNYFNDAIEVNNKEGYYVDMIIPDHLVTVGKVADQVDITLKSGWNLVGNPCLTDKLRDDALSSISGKYNMVERYDTTKDKEVRLTASDFIQTGDGHWIHATANCVLTITN
jgi:hypothetical protein